MPRITLTPEPLTAEGFAPFGQVVEIADQEPIVINDGNTLRYDSLAKVELSAPGDRAAINLFRAQPRQLPMRITMLERHPQGSQSFHPLSGQPYLVLVALPGDPPEPESLRLFLAGPQQGINYARNTWHHPVLGLNQVCDFLVVDRKGAGNNCIEHHFDDRWTITIESAELPQ